MRVRDASASSEARNGVHSSEHILATYWGIEVHDSSIRE